MVWCGVVWCDGVRMMVILVVIVILWMWWAHTHSHTCLATALARSLVDSVFPVPAGPSGAPPRLSFSAPISVLWPPVWSTPTSQVTKQSTPLQPLFGQPKHLFQASRPIHPTSTLLYPSIHLLSPNHPPSSIHQSTFFHPHTPLHPSLIFQHL